MIAFAIVLTIASVGQIILAFLLYDPEGNTLLINIGWCVLMLSAIFGWLPIITFRRKGGVKGKGYIHTTVLVDEGIYAIVRHPQYLAGVLINAALPMITQHWTVAVLGMIAAAINYLNTYDEEKGCIEKFGEEYKIYMQSVPRMNFIIGIIRAIRK
jgi:protein-S-isoprenylcysteine O-methyltransferase Ste14